MKAKSAEGFSIVELIIAIVVGVTFIGSMNLVVDNYNNLSRRTRNLVLANSFADGKVEALRNDGYNALNIGTTDLSSQLPSQLPKPASSSLTIAQAQPGIKQVDISLTYNDQGITRTYNYRTYIGELGVGQ